MNKANIRVENCRSCNADVVWFKTAAGKAMPVDAHTVEPGDSTDHLELPRHVSHFATCPNSKFWRKSK